MINQDMSTECKKSFGERYKAHADALSLKPDYVAAGDLGRELGAEYMKQLMDMIEKHSMLKGIYYIFVLQHQNMMYPNAQYLTFCSMREMPKNAHPGADLWKVNNESCKYEIVWTLPHSESWDQVKMDINTPKFLLECMQKFEKGIL